MLIGLNSLQTGNREGILRVRARDAANFVAQHVLDSISAAGIKAIDKTTSVKSTCSTPPTDDLIYCEPDYIYNFEGKPQLDKSTAGIKMETKYEVQVFVSNDPDTKMVSNGDSSLFAGKSKTISQSVEAVVSWDFKKSRQSISMARVVR